MRHRRHNRGGKRPQARFLSEPLESRVLLTTYPVTTTADSGTGSLRQAILNANGHAGLDMISFSITGSGVHVISPASALPTITGPVLIDGSTQTGYTTKPVIEINGASAGSSVDGLDISGGGTTLNALDITNFSGSGISMYTSGGNLVENCFVGADPTGTVAAGNFVYGVVISGGSSNNTISNNLISGNGTDPSSKQSGISIFGTGTASNTVSGNKIGTDVTGKIGIGNGAGVFTGDAATGTTISNNLISANGVSFQFAGVQIYQGNSNTVTGNLIGTDITGTQALGNGGDGVLINGGSQFNRVGTNGDGVNDAAERNIISGNGVGSGYSGVEISGTNSDSNVVAGNYIGTDITGTLPVGNGGEGVFLGYGAQLNRIGVNGADVDAAGERNIISANGFTGFYAGVQIYGTGTNQNVLAGNYIGTDVTGLVALGNAGVGIYINGGVQNNLIGTNGDGVGDALERNIIANSGYQGIYLADVGTTGNVIAGNYIGAKANGAPQGNGNNGIWIDNGAQNNRIGTNGTDVDAVGEGNLIIANSFSGIIITDPNPATSHSTGNSIRGNSIHNNGAGYIGINLNGDFNLNHSTVVEPGPNNFNNYPNLISGTPGAATVITGSYTGPVSTAETIDFYASSNADGPYDGTGDRWLGATIVNTGATGTVSFTATVGTAASGEFISATATDSGGNTSEFSTPILLPAVQLQSNAGAWTPIGPAPIMESVGNAPTVSGRVVEATPDPTNSNVMYIATDGGGVWKTTDWLDTVPTWTPLTDTMPSDQFSNNSYSPLALAPSNAQIVYAAVSGPGGGILKSVNGGSTWSELANSVFDQASFGSVVVDPTNANTVYASVWYGATGGGGIYKSTGGGTTWTNTTASIHNGSASDIVINPSNHLILYAGLVGDTSGSSANNGIYETTNGGTSWTLLSNGVISGSAVGVSVRLTISPSAPSDLYATVFDPALGNAPDGMPHRYETINGGTSWTALLALPSGDEPRYWHALLAVDPHNPSIVYVNGDHTLFQSVDGGVTWTQIYAEDPVNVTFDDTGAVIETGDRGIYRWTGGSAPFANKQGNLQDAEFYTLTLSPTDPLTVYGIAQDQLAGLKTVDGTVWNYMGGADEVGRVIVDPNNPNTLYEFDPNNGGSPSNIEGAPSPSGDLSPDDDTLHFIWKSTDGGANWTPDDTGVPTTDVGYNLAYTSQRAFVMDPTNDNRMLLGVDQVYETTNDGTSWTTISPVLSAGQFISSIAIAPSAPNTVYAATGDGRLFVTTNDFTWTERDAGLPLNYYAHVMDMEVDPANPQHAFVVCGTFLGGDNDAYHVFVTTNGGVSWTNITGNLPFEDAGQSLAVDWRFATPRLYVGTLRGVFLSTDNGAHWNAFGANMPNTIVTDLELSTTFNVLAAATYGRGAFEMRIPAAISDVITGTAAVDGITLVQDYDHQHIDWTLGNNSGQLLITDAAGLTINGNGGNDIITLLYTNGNPLPNTIDLNGAFILNGLTGSNPLANTKLDINASTIFITYANPASDPISTIRGDLQNGYNNGAWTGTPTGTTGVITSTAAAANVNRTTAIGYADSSEGLVVLPANTIELKYTLYGDTGLTGSVGFTDFMRMTQHYTQNGGATWGKGDFNYDGSVNAADFNLLKPNYGQTLPAPSPAPMIMPPAPSGRVATIPPPPSALAEAAPSTPTVTVVQAVIDDTSKSKAHHGKAHTRKKRH